jgi:peptidoglycan/LPS O-acetylase OafA/YrhL
VAGVLLFHAGHLTGGYLGVDLFFVLSGFLITSLLVLEWTATGTVELGRFWARRARRLLPAMFAVLIAVAVAARWYVAPESQESLRDEGWATLGYVANWFAIVRTEGYWEQTLLPSWLQHTWSLAIEEQFYVVWPLVVGAVFGIWRRSARSAGTAPPRDPAAVRASVRRLGWLAWAGAAASAGLMIVWSLLGGSRERLYLGTDTRVAAILLGAGLACWQHLSGRMQTDHGAVGDEPPSAVRTGADGFSLGRRTVDRRWLSVAGVVAAAALVVAWAALDGTEPLLYRGGLLACGLAATVVLLDVTTPGATPLRPVLELAPLRWLGLISYGLYLWHWPVYQYLLPGRFGLQGWSLVVVRIGVSLAVAVASYHLVELPIRRGALRGALVKVALPAAVIVAALALFLGTTNAIDTPTTPAAGASPGFDDDEAGPRVMVLGDSVAFALASDGLDPLEGELGIGVSNRAEIGCTLMREVDDPLSEAIRNCSPDWPGFVGQDRPDIVLLLFGGYVGIVPAEVDGREVDACDPAYDDLWAERLTEAVDTLSATGATVVLSSSPTAADEVFKGEDPATFDAQQRCNNEVIEAVAAEHPRAAFVDLAGYVCPPEGCQVEIDGVKLRGDGVHYRNEGAETIARWLVPRVLEAAGEP